MDVIERLKKKDEGALRELMKQYGDYLLRTAFLLVRDIHVAEEAVQDTFVIAFMKIEQLHDCANLKRWLTTIVINQCRARMRKWSWKNILLKFDGNDDSKLEDAIVGASNLPETLVIQASENSFLYQSIQQLDYIYREVITLFYLNELRIEEISELLRENENTIKTRLRRGKGKLKTLLEQGGKDDVG